MRSCSLRIAISLSRLETSMDFNGSRMDGVAGVGAAVGAAPVFSSGGTFITDVFTSSDDDFASTAGWEAALIGFMNPSDELFGTGLRGQKKATLPATH